MTPPCDLFQVMLISLPPIWRVPIDVTPTHVLVYYLTLSPFSNGRFTHSFGEVVTYLGKDMFILTKNTAPPLRNARL